MNDNVVSFPGAYISPPSDVEPTTDYFTHVAERNALSVLESAAQELLTAIGAAPTVAELRVLADAIEENYG